MPILVKRLKPGQDVYNELKALVSDQKIDAGVVLSLVGSLKTGSLRFADQPDASSIKGPLEIVSATGTLGQSGLHVHASFSNSSGQTFGGHLMPGNLVYTTCEIVVHDSGYPELVGVSLHLK